MTMAWAHWFVSWSIAVAGTFAGAAFLSYIIVGLNEPLISDWEFDTEGFYLHMAVLLVLVSVAWCCGLATWYGLLWLVPAGCCLYFAGRGLAATNADEDGGTQ